MNLSLSRKEIILKHETTLLGFFVEGLNVFVIMYKGNVLENI